MCHFQLKIRNQRGESTALNITLALIALVVVMAIWKFGFPYFQYMRYAHFVQKQVDYDAENRRVDTSLIQEIYSRVESKAMNMKLPVKGNQIHIDRDVDHVTVRIDYTEHVNLYLYEFDWKFTIEKSSEGLGIKP